MTTSHVRAHHRAVAVFERHPLIPITFGVCLFSTGPVMVAGTDASGLVLSFWRLWCGAALLGVLTLVHIRRTGRRPDRLGWSKAAKAGLGFGLHQLFFMVAIKATSVVDVTLMQALQPVFVGILAATMFGERPGPAFRMWSLLAIAGAGVVALAGATGPEGDPLGLAMAVANVAFFALYFVWSKQARGHIDTVPLLFGVIVTAGTVVSVFAVLTGENIGGISRHDLLFAALIALVPGGLGHFVMVWPLNRVAANVPALVQLAMPFLAGALAWLLLGQGITLLHLVGGALTVGGVAGALLSPAGRRLSGGAGTPSR
ncbi:MAG: DMT family transporter [Actinomycetota bacterium]|nr:DMT family transporter [Actinomycetota bacterium]